MSLHAQLSPEALAILRSRQRNSTISSIIIALLVVVLVGVLLLLILLPSVDNFTPEIVSYQSGVEEENKVKKKIMNHAVERKPSSPSSSMARVIASNSVSNIAIPMRRCLPSPLTLEMAKTLVMAGVMVTAGELAVEPPFLVIPSVVIESCM
jgi:predicted PurR-regulated permease PerM